eukprot:4732306-Pleurochrysis_carterae.AAC.1
MTHPNESSRLRIQRAAPTSTDRGCALAAAGRSRLQLPGSRRRWPQRRQEQHGPKGLAHGHFSSCVA